jgi:hypothetical protein
MSLATERLTIPGVYRQEVFPRPVPLLPTGVPVFLGLSAGAQGEAPRDPAIALTPLRLTHWPQFLERLGNHHRRSPLGAAVHGFFANGGELCYVVMADTTAAPGLEHALDQALAVAEAIADIDLVCMPDLWGTVKTPTAVRRLQQQILDHCDRVNDRFALLDAPLVTHPDRWAELHPTGLRGSNGALYGPWLKPEGGGGWVPPSGHVAGLIARCDRTYGVHRAPANLVIDDALDLSLGLSEADQQRLTLPNQPGVNCLRSLPGRGIRPWGARTLSADPLVRYISGRRLLITVGRWAALTLAKVAFEPNDIVLWLRIEREVTAYLATLAQQGALQGETAAESFFVKCDRETNPPPVREQGQVVTLVGLAPAVPGEFIVLRLIHGETGVTLTTTSSHSPG